MRVVQFAVAALSLLVMSPALAQEDPAQIEQASGAHMGHDMMQMMMSCARLGPEMMKAANGHDHDKGAGEMDNGPRGMPGMMQGHAESDETLGFTAVEAIARAFLAGRTEAVDRGLEVVALSVRNGSYLVEYRFQEETRFLQIDARTGAVTRAGNE